MLLISYAFTLLSHLILTLSLLILLCVFPYTSVGHRVHREVTGQHGGIGSSIPLVDPRDQTQLVGLAANAFVP